MNKSTLLATSAVALFGMGLATPAFAQDSTPAQRQDQSTAPAVKPATDATTTQEKANSAQPGDQTITVTGSILRRTTVETPSPVTIVTAESLDQRGISTVQDAVQKLASNNGPALTNSFTANGAFAGGASSVSLRGLTTNSTLVLFDGQRAAYYPLADDGARNFVDLNAIPDDIVERVEVLRDGASSSYGADAIAGVVNIITRREFNGVQARAEAGISQDGLAPEQRLSLTAGVGSIRDKGFNAYISGFFYHSGMVKARDLDYPYNTSDESGICYHGNCGPNGIFNATDPNGVLFPFSYTPNGLGFTFRTLNPASPTGGATGQYSNASCGNLPTHVITQDDIDAQNPAIQSRFFLGQVICQTDFQKLFGVVNPKITRWGISGRVTADIGGNNEAYAEVNFLNSKTYYTGFGYRLNRRAPAPIFFPAFNLSSNSSSFAPGSFPLTLPAYICPGSTVVADGNNGCTATSPGAQVNPDANIDPVTGLPVRTQVYGGFPNLTPTNTTNERAYRLETGIKGHVFNGWDYNIEGTVNHTDLDIGATGYANFYNLLQAIGTGAISLRDPLSNSQAQFDVIAPKKVFTATSDLYAIQGTIGRTLMQLSGGPLQLGLGAQARYEAVNDPSGNTDANGAINRFEVLNAFGAVGHRYVYSAFGEIQAPVTDMIELDASGRYDKYSSGQNAFSPKFGFKFKPVKQLLLRGTYSKGFRIPSFGEAASFPTTGYVTATSGLYSQDYLATYGCSGGSFSSSSCLYVNNAAVGLTTLKNPALDPEKSRSITLGALFEPRRGISFTVDFWDINKKNAISNPDFSAAEAAYYACTTQAQFDAGLCSVPGINVVQDIPDPNHPTNLPRIAFLEGTYINANTIHAQGFDLGASATQRFGSVKYSTALDASYVAKLSTSFPSGVVQKYPGTLGNFNLTAGSGTPRWHGTWQNTLDFGRFALTGTGNYWSGYNLSAEDQTGPGTAGQCGLAGAGFFTPCDVKSYITVDAVGQFKITDRYNLYLTVINAFDRLPPIDAVTYGAYLYNPVTGGDGIFGRMFKAGIKANF